MGAMEELNLRPGVITGDDVLKVFFSFFPIADFSSLSMLVQSNLLFLLS
jgi:hypothetical protein